MVRKTPFVSVNLTEPARDKLRRVTLGYTSPAGRRLSMSEVLLAALDFAEAHEGEFLDALTAPSPADAVEHGHG